MSFKLNYTSYVHKRIRENVNRLEKLTNTTCNNIDNTFSGFLMFVSVDKTSMFIITIKKQFYFVSLNEKNSDNIYRIVEDNIPLVDWILEDLHWLDTWDKNKSKWNC